jgi:hypothetical protein
VNVEAGATKTLNISDAHWPFEQDSYYIILEAVSQGTTFVSSSATSLQSQGQVAAPVFDPPPGDYSSQQQVTVTSETSGARIYANIGGTADRNLQRGTGLTSGTQELNSSYPVSSTTTISAFAAKDDWEDSDTVFAEYVLGPGTELTFFPRLPVMNVRSEFEFDNETSVSLLLEPDSAGTYTVELTPVQNESGDIHEVVAELLQLESSSVSDGINELNLGTGSDPVNKTLTLDAGKYHLRVREPHNQSISGRFEIQVYPSQ